MDRCLFLFYLLFYFLTVNDGKYCRRKSVSSVLVLAGIELIFFIVARMRLCFGFVLRTVLIIQGCFRYR